MVPCVFLCFLVFVLSWLVSPTLAFSCFCCCCRCSCHWCLYVLPLWVLLSSRHFLQFLEWFMRRNLHPSLQFMIWTVFTIIMRTFGFIPTCLSCPGSAKVTAGWTSRWVQWGVPVGMWAYHHNWLCPRLASPQLRSDGRKSEDSKLDSGSQCQSDCPNLPKTATRISKTKISTLESTW